MSTEYSTMINVKKAEEPSNSILLGEQKSIKKELVQMKKIKKEVQWLTTRLDKAYKIINRQQIFLEFHDAKESWRNLVLTWLSEDADEIGAVDSEKVKKVLQAASYPCSFDTTVWLFKCLGQPNDKKKRPLHVTVEDQERRNSILRVAKNLKNANGPLSTIYIRKDIDPASRKEMMRIRSRERKEKEKPENIGVNITYNRKKPCTSM